VLCIYHAKRAYFRAAYVFNADRNKRPHRYFTDLLHKLGDRGLMVLLRDPDVAVDACFCYGSLLCSLKSYQETHLRMSGRAAANREVYALLDYIHIYRNVLCGSDEKFPKDK
jgi:hypothetical protein